MNGVQVDEFVGRAGEDPVMFSRTRHFAFASEAGRMRIESTALNERGAKLYRVRSTGHEVALTEETHVNVIVPLRGEIRVAAAAADFMARRDDVLVFGPNERRTVVIPDSDGVYEALVLALRRDDPRSLAIAPLAADGGRLTIPASADRMAGAVLGLFALLRQGDEVSDRPARLSAAARALEDRLSVFLLEARRTEAPRRVPTAGLRQLRLAEEFIRFNAGATLRIEDIAAAAGVGPRALQATFRRHRGLTPHQVLTRIRLESARLRLAEGRPTDRVTDIELHAGFTHLGRFSQVYAQRFGESPSATLRRAQNGRAPA